MIHYCLAITLLPFSFKHTENVEKQFKQTNKPNTTPVHIALDNGYNTPPFL